jgi:cytochrome c oxidase subunit 2
MVCLLTINLVFNEIEYFTYMNIGLVSLLIYIIIYFIFVNSCCLFFSNVCVQDLYIEFISTLCSLMFLLTIISPAVLIILESDINIMASCILQSLGYQWAWTFSLYFLYSFYYFSTFIVDLYYCSSLVDSFIIYLLLSLSAYLIIPLWSIIKILVVSIDVIHSLGCYSFGIKIDAIPGRINLALLALRSLNKGEHRGFCFELCGYGHYNMSLAILLI